MYLQSSSAPNPELTDPNYYLETEYGPDPASADVPSDPAPTPDLGRNSGLLDNSTY